MKMRLNSLILAGILGIAGPVFARPVELASGPAPVAILELYTSEGCWSCPPGEAWLSGLVDSNQLWRAVVPVAFHVDYWDYIGWPDPLGSPAHSERQRRYASEWRSRTIYTPGFVLQGREWKDGHRDLRDAANAKGGGTLHVAGAVPGELSVDFSGDAGGPWVAQAAILGTGIDIDVKAGENAGHKLRHDFAVLQWQTGATDQSGHATFKFPALPRDHGAGRLAIAIWIERAGSPVPIQAAGGWLDAEAATQPE